MMINKVSIIIPVYNVAEYLPRCIDSVLKQDGIEIELLLVNDGSTDRSGEICDEYAEQDKRIVVFHQMNGGVSSARNKGIKNATGEWICFVDADDWIEPNSLTEIIKVNDKTDTDIVIARSFANRNGDAVRESFAFNENMEGKIFKGIELFIKEGYMRGSVWGVAYRRLFLLKHDIDFPLNLKIGEDSIFFSLCTIYAKKVSFANVYFYNLYEREGSAFRSWTFNKMLSMVDNISFIDEYIASHPGLNSNAINILNYSKYGVVSNIYNYFHLTFSIENYLMLRKKIRGTLKGKIDTGNIKTNRGKVRILNFSLDIFAIMVLLKNKIVNL